MPRIRLDPPADLPPPGPGLEFSEWFQVVPVAALYYSGNVTGPPCMAYRRRRSSWVRWSRQLVPRRATRCCTFHGADWRAASEEAIRLLAEAYAAGIVDPDDVSDYASEHCRFEHDGPYGTAAGVGALLDPGTAICPVTSGDEPALYDGRHRTIAMIDAGVRRTVALVSARVSD